MRARRFTLHYGFKKLAILECGSQVPQTVLTMLAAIATLATSGAVGSVSAAWAVAENCKHFRRVQLPDQLRTGMAQLTKNS